MGKWSCGRHGPAQLGGYEMPLYTFKGCACAGSFDRLASYTDVTVVCKECNQTATRVAYYGRQAVRMEDAEIPANEPEYDREAQKRALRSRGWDYDRALEHIRSNVVETAHGKSVNLNG